VVNNANGSGGTRVSDSGKDCILLPRQSILLQRTPRLRAQAFP
jgi:hypothetical protein